MFEIVRRMNNSKKVAYLFLVLGIFPIIFGIFVFKDTYSFVSNSKELTGTVEGLVYDDGSYYPLVSFIDLDGNSRQFRAKGGCSPSCYKELELVNVLYNLERSEPRIDSFFQLWLPVVLLLFIGTVFVLTSVSKLKDLKQRAI